MCGRRAIRHFDRPAFTLVETLVVVSIAGVLLTLILPALQAAREASRRVACQDNLHQIGISTLSYEAANAALPIGARSHRVRGDPNSTFGFSWWVEILGHLEQSTLREQLDLESTHPGWAVLHAANGRVVDRKVVVALLCPSSSLPSMGRVGGFEIMMPSYVGIAGASSHDDFAESRVNRCCLPENEGEISGGGALIANAAVRMEEILDGTSCTLLAGECSDFAWDGNGRPRRIDGGHPNGWITGTSASGTPPAYDVQPSPSWNIITLRYGLNVRDYLLPGVDENRGANNPLVSAHMGGVNALMVGGAVMFLHDEMDVAVVKSLATRDDGQR